MLKTIFNLNLRFISDGYEINYNNDVQKVMRRLEDVRGVVFNARTDGTDWRVLLKKSFRNFER